MRLVPRIAALLLVEIVHAVAVIAVALAQVAAAVPVHGILGAARVPVVTIIAVIAVAMATAVIPVSETITVAITAAACGLMAVETRSGALMRWLSRVAAILLFAIAWEGRPFLAAIAAQALTAPVAAIEV